MNQIDRIAAMEQALDRARAALDACESALPDLQRLSAYMDSGDWLRDYQADEAGLIPRDMKRGVLSQDALYDLLTRWEALRRQAPTANSTVPKPVIHIFGASGSGTTTLGRALCKRLGFIHMDTDDYFWLPTDPKFTAKRPVAERLTLMEADIDAAERGVVISGSLTGWGDPLIPRFTLVIRVVTDMAVRIERLRAREYAHFGERIHEGGDMHRNHLEFLDWAAQYDTGDVTMRSKACHDEWQALLSCPVLTVDGTMPLDALTSQVLADFPAIAIRPMQISDYDALYALWLATPGMGLNTTDDSREGIARYLQRNPHTCFVAELDGRLVGAIMAGHDGRRGYISHTCVRTDCRGVGLGRALVERTLSALRAEGIHKVALVVFDRNTGGNAFWERMGFTRREDLVYRNRSLTALERIDT